MLVSNWPWPFRHTVFGLYGTALMALQLKTTLPTKTSFGLTYPQGILQVFA